MFALIRPSIAALCLTLLAITTLLHAQSAAGYPASVSTTVNDFADLLPEKEEAALDAILKSFTQETGVEMTIVTLDSYDRYAPREDISIEQFATGLFNDWGVGDAARNDGVMILVVRDDRVMRIELGQAYGRAWDRAAAVVIDRHFLDAFAAGDYIGGIFKGTQATMNQLVRPFLGLEPVTIEETQSTGRWVPFTIVGVLMAALFFGIPLLKTLRRCPKCGARSLKSTRETIMGPSAAVPGMGRKTTTCSSCGHRFEDTYVIASLNSRHTTGGASGGGSFGGGSSGGGGATGRW
ncbi:TPM domain-containing protein [Primorskyibacter sp. S187A]|uniref:TPM domain-containing protein n=1 Tax=Primorskyibacter sp. S187A TaxID=3415130 RepID=UPI003C7E1755